MKNCLSLYLILVVVSSSCVVASSSHTNLQNFTGSYKNGREVINIDSKNHFYIYKENAIKQDVAVLECTDTIAKGMWKLMQNNLLQFSNDSSFGSVAYSVKQEKRNSEDTLYFQIEIPSLDTFFYEKFYFYVSNYFYGQIESKKSYFEIPKRNFNIKSFGLLLQDIDPNCYEERKCYQRIYFRIFQDFKILDNKNSFKINLKSFNQCYVEQMDMEGEFLYVKKGFLYWQGKTYKKI